jgi:integrase
MLVYLTASRVQGSSMDTYASAMHRFTSFGIHVKGLPLAQVLPPGPKGVVDIALVKLWISHAASRYKISTIRVTLCALVDWHKSKLAPHDSVSPSHPEIKALLQSLAIQQGPAGLPVGKVGMSKAVLRLLLGYLSSLMSSDPTMAALHERDAVWLLLGFVGMLRRSEIISLTMADIQIIESGTPHIALHISRSKTDKRQAGTTVLAAAQSRDGINVLERVTAYVQRRQVRDGATASDPLFPSWNLDSRTLQKSVPLKNGAALAQRLKLHLTELLHRYPRIADNPASYGMHSLRRAG